MPKKKIAETEAKPKPKSAGSVSRKNTKKLYAHKRFWLTSVVAMALLLSVALWSTFVWHPKPQSFPEPVSVWRNVADILAQHPIGTVVSNRDSLTSLQPVIDPKQATLTLNACPTENDMVVQKLQHHSFAVLLQINASAGPQQCTLAQIVQAYGRPNSSVTVIGTLANPKKVLLFYDNGPGTSGPVKPISPPAAPSTVVPINLSSLPRLTCSGKTILTVVAHQDDDLLFMNPDHIHDIQAGDCMRTIYLTAGDAGSLSAYWLSRERGAEAAYDTMIGKGSSLWIERIVAINAHEYVRMASPKGNASVTLVFVRLPDGNLNGAGFARTHFQSLERLYEGDIATMDADDGQSTYSKDDLIAMLSGLMAYFQPDEVATQAPVNMSSVHPEHSDHLATGMYTQAAFTHYTAGGAVQNPSLVSYIGYPIDQMDPNVSGQDFIDKSNAFYAYALHDTHACDTPAKCVSTPYSQWLQRQYPYTPQPAS